MKNLVLVLVLSIFTMGCSDGLISENELVLIEKTEIQEKTPVSFKKPEVTLPRSNDKFYNHSWTDKVFIDFSADASPTDIIEFHYEGVFTGNKGVVISDDRFNPYNVHSVNIYDEDIYSVYARSKRSGKKSETIYFSVFIDVTCNVCR